MARQSTRRPRPAEQAVQRYNVSNETIRELMFAAIDLNGEIKAAKGALLKVSHKMNAHYKRCEAAGIATRHVKWFVREYGRPVEEVYLERQERRRIAVATDLPLDPVWDEALPAAPVLPDPAEAQRAAEREAQIQRWFDEGYDAARSGKHWETCPYNAPTPERDAWMNGWERFEAQAAQPPPPPPHDDLGPVAEDGDVPVFQ